MEPTNNKNGKTALAQVWTWVGTAFCPIAIGWIFFVRGGPVEKAAEAVLISRAYWGFGMSLATTALLLWTVALYVSDMKKEGAPIYVPPNALFENVGRDRRVSWTTLVVFFLVAIGSVLLFGARYHDSEIHRWDSQTALKTGFWHSRLQAHSEGCSANPCYAVGQRWVPQGGVDDGTIEYLLYWTDGALIFLIGALSAGLVYLLVVLKRPARGSPPPVALALSQ